jgi:inosine/xanthosine triphosphate pyrophosphatase family protein
MILKICTGNEAKFREFESFFEWKLEWIRRDLPEPVADSETIVRFKASQLPETLIDDAALFVEGEDLGTLIKWRMSELDRLIGRRAEFRCYLGIQRQERVEIFIGVVPGKICSFQPGGFGFDGYFIPEGSSVSYAKSKDREKNARYLAVQKFLQRKPDRLANPLKEWNGEFQK